MDNVRNEYQRMYKNDNKQNTKTQKDTKKFKIITRIRIVNITTVIAIFLFQALFAQTVAVCPTRCHCNEDSLYVSCIDSGLDLVPILLNPELLQLNLTHNKITNLHYTLSFYNNLNILDLSYNKIQTFGSMNFELQHQLIKLNLSNNYVKNISKDTFKGLKRLEILDLSNNQLINVMPSAFIDLKMLQIFYLNNNNLISFESDLFTHVSKLKKLFLNSNQLLEIPINLISHTKQLEYLDLSHNLIEQIDYIIDLPKLEYLALDSNVISNISLNAFDQLISMKYLDLTDNNLYFVPTEQMSKLINLTILKISGNFIEHIDTLAFRSLFQLKYLYLSRMNRLYTIDSRAFIDNINLESLWMDSNTELVKIPTRMFHTHSRMLHISMRDNVFITLEPDHFPLDQLQTLQLSGEHYVCNCSLLWLWKLIQDEHDTNNNNAHTLTHVQQQQQQQQQTTLSIDANQIICTLPPELSKVQLINVRESDITCSRDWATVIIGIILVIFVTTVIASVISYKKRYKCLPDRRATNTSTLRHRNDISGPSLMGQSYPAMLYNGPPHHIHRPKSNLTPTHWDVSFQEQYSQSDFPTSPQPQMKHKPPHIVFV